MRVLVGCEFSGTVRDAFIRQGHDAISCDLLPTDAPGPHIQGDLLDVLKTRAGEFDLAIFHPPCTYLSNSGVRWLYDPRTPTRWQDMVLGAAFFRRLLEAEIPRVAVENPVMHRWAREIVGRGPDQTIQPFHHGHPERKATSLWLRGLPLLQPTDDVEAEMKARPTSEAQRIWYASPGPDRWKLRSATYLGIAEAMAAQWGTP